ncbi:hypothetical protein SAMN05443999_101228 [Roseovarius azorensis]|uniref:HEPN domain-containing protein n=1 Tax=Roseovarius azorensis TaxID=1287727 RepID=A0A1H7G8M2_9RHOB|nr:hypothetical protein [Roseovarius azorensis]SEK33162.1 hypothetical protein SAMN05443999_101228 [Roseovarius azorensis]
MTDKNETYRAHQLAKWILQSAQKVEFIAGMRDLGDPIYEAYPDVPVFLLRSELDALGNMVTAMRKALDDE